MGVENISDAKTGFPKMLQEDWAQKLSLWVHRNQAGLGSLGWPPCLHPAHRLSLPSLRHRHPSAWEMQL